MLEIIVSMIIMMYPGLCNYTEFGVETAKVMAVTHMYEKILGQVAANILVDIITILVIRPKKNWLSVVLASLLVK